MSSSDEQQQILLLGNITMYLFRYGGLILFFIGNIGNILCILVFSKKVWRKNVCVFYFLVGIGCNFVFIDASMLATICMIGFNVDIQNRNDVLCKLTFYIGYVCSTYFPTVLILASVDRLLISSQNVDMRLYSSRRLAYFSVITGAIFWLIFSSHTLIKSGVQEVYPSVFVCYYEMSVFYMDFFSYSVLVITVAIPLTMVVLSILAFKNVRRIRAVPRQQRKRVRSMSKKDFQLLRCLYIHNVVYIFFSSMIGVSIVYGRILKYQNTTLWQQTVDTFVNNVATFVHYIPYCCSFFIFYITSRAFRQELKRYLYKILGKDLTTIREDEVQPVEPTAHDFNDQINVAAISTVALRE